MGTERDSLGIAVLDPDVHVGHATVECTRARIAHTVLIRDDATDEPEHVLALSFVGRVFIGKAGRILGQDEQRAGLAVADDANGLRDVDGTADAVLPFRNEQDAETLLRLHLVDGALERFRDIGLSVRRDAVGFGREEKGTRVVGLLRVHALLPDG